MLPFTMWPWTIEWSKRGGLTHGGLKWEVGMKDVSIFYRKNEHLFLL